MAVMPRMARIVVPDCPHHVTQRGNRREAVFQTDADRQRLLGLLKGYAADRGLTVQAYCLMPNHVHLVATPKTAEALAAVLKPVFLRYAQHVNWTHGLAGRLWQGRFYSCPLDERHFWAAVRYVERNPVRAGLVRKAHRYPWSSAAAHCGLRADPLLADAAELVEQVGDWAAWLAEPEDEDIVSQLRLRTRTGRPAGAEAFIDRLERLVGRALRPRKGGRPRKHPKPDKNQGNVPMF